MVDRLARRMKFARALYTFPTPSKITDLKFCARSLRTLGYVRLSAVDIGTSLVADERNSRTTHGGTIDSGTEQNSRDM